MTTEATKQDIAALERQGWRADTAARALVQTFGHETYDKTVRFLVRLGQKAQETGATPWIEIENGTEVTVRIGQPPAPTLTAAEIELAKSLNFG